MFRGKRIYVWAFLLCSFAMLLCMLCGGVLGPNTTILESDLLGTYVPAIRSFWRSCISGERLDYSWNICLGMNTSAFYAYYVGSSIVNLLYLFFFQVDPQWITILVILIKTGLAGCGFVYFVNRFQKQREEYTLAFSIFYALCAYQLFINTINTIWMDAVYILPFLLAFLIDFVEKNHWKRLVICYVYLFTVNFYSAYMVGIFSAIFFLLYLCLLSENRRDQKQSIKRIMQYGVCVLLAVGMSAVILLPAGLFILNNRAQDSTDILSLSVNLLQVYNQLFIGENSNISSVLPSLYAGLPSILLLPFFFGSKHIPIRRKMFFGVLLLVLVVAYFSTFMCMFWHCFDVPDGWPYRFSYIVSFLICVMAVLSVGEVEKSSSLLLPGIAALHFIFYLFMGAYQHKVSPEAISNDGIRMVWNLLFMILWSLILSRKIFCWKNIVIYLAIAEVVVNGFYMFEMHERPSQTDYEQWYENGLQVKKELNRDEGFYRVDVENDLEFSTDSFFGFHGIEDFGTLENYPLRKALNSLGIYTSPRVLRNYGVTPFTRLLLGMKYQMNGGEGEELLSELENYLSIGFVVNELMSQGTYEDPNVFENMNRLASDMIGEEIAIFYPISADTISYSGRGITMGQYADGRTFLSAEFDDSNMKYITMQVPDDGQELYVAIDSGDSEILLGDPYILDQDTDLATYKSYDYKRLGVKYAKKMDLVNGNRVLAIGMDANTTGSYFEFNDIWFYALDQEQLDYFYQKVSANQWDIDNYKNGYVSGKIHISAENQMLFTSIPYDQGWKITSDSSGVTIVPVLNDAFLGVKFAQAGEYDLELQYEAPGVRTGLWLSGLFILAFTIGGIITWRFRSKEKKAETGIISHPFWSVDFP